MSAEQQPLIQIRNLGTRFGNDWVHKGLNLKIYPNRVINIIGESGCGKTTLIREILMLEPISAGEIYLMGQRIYSSRGNSVSMKALASKMGMMFQHCALFSNLTCIENVMFPLMEFTDFSKKTIEDIARLKLNMVGLGDYAHHKYPSSLSGGMLKRTALARTIALDPKVVFLDEPSAGLDPPSVYQQNCLIRELQASLNLTVIMITHDLDTIWSIADEIIYMGDKKVLVHDTVANAAERSDHPGLYDFFNGPRGKICNDADTQKGTS